MINKVGHMFKFEYNKLNLNKCPTLIWVSYVPQMDDLGDHRPYLFTSID